ncbi:NRT2 ribosyltransferase, partial [Odontophorus gujanensis]|nr:NRT2 ribosyltransferase [Odontophorus gujanensis]
MEHLAPRWVLLAGTLLGTLATGSTRSARDLSPTQTPMDTAPESFDDDYKGCVEQMRAELPELNCTEFTHNRVYAEGWKAAAAEWQRRWGGRPQPGQLRQEQAIALLAYTGGSKLHKQFNEDTRRGGCSHQHYLNSYHFKALHFLLTTALRDLRRSHPSECHHVFRGVRDVRFAAKKGSAVRFGHFASSSLQRNISKRFGTDTFFEIRTCLGAPIKHFSSVPCEDEDLIPPFEVFKVTEFRRVNGGNLIHLHSNGMQSRHTCELLK